MATTTQPTGSARTQEEPPGTAGAGLSRRQDDALRRLRT